MVAFALVRWIYYPSSPVKSHVFTFLAFNTIIYFVISILTDSEMGVGIGFGLFAIFSLLRYRTDPIPIREMTYLILPLHNSVTVKVNHIRLAQFQLYRQRGKYHELQSYLHQDIEDRKSVV